MPWLCCQHPPSQSSSVWARAGTAAAYKVQLKGTLHCMSSSTDPAPAALPECPLLVMVKSPCSGRPYPLSSSCSSCTLYTTFFLWMSMGDCCLPAQAAKCSPQCSSSSSPSVWRSRQVISMRWKLMLAQESENVQYFICRAAELQSVKPA